MDENRSSLWGRRESYFPLQILSTVAEVVGLYELATLSFPAACVITSATELMINGPREEMLITNRCRHWAVLWSPVQVRLGPHVIRHIQIMAQT